MSQLMQRLLIVRLIHSQQSPGRDHSWKFFLTRSGCFSQGKGPQPLQKKPRINGEWMVVDQNPKNADHEAKKIMPIFIRYKIELKVVFMKYL